MKPLGVNIWLCLFFLISGIHLFGKCDESFLLSASHTKPLLIPLLLAYFISKTKTAKTTSIRLVYAALICSFAGDVFLIFSGPLYFLLGLGSFLLTHILYILVFIRVRKQDTSEGKTLLWTIPIYLYGGLILYQLWPYIEGMYLPVTLYALTISTMLYTAIRLAGTIPKHIFIFLFVGAISFIISDTVLAWDLFVKPSYTIPCYLVMSTYLLGQYLLIEGFIRLFQHPA